jgi:hypothetical protein
MSSSLDGQMVVGDAAVVVHWDDVRQWDFERIGETLGLHPLDARDLLGETVRCAMPAGSIEIDSAGDAVEWRIPGVGTDARLAATLEQVRLLCNARFEAVDGLDLTVSLGGALALEHTFENAIARAHRAHMTATGRGGDCSVVQAPDWEPGDRPDAHVDPPSAMFGFGSRLEAFLEVTGAGVLHLSIGGNAPDDTWRLVLAAIGERHDLFALRPASLTALLGDVDENETVAAAARARAAVAEASGGSVFLTVGAAWAPRGSDGVAVFAAALRAFVEAERGADQLIVARDLAA